MAYFNRSNEPMANSRLLIQWIHERVSPYDSILIRSIDQYSMLSELGRGRFGKVCSYINNETKTTITVKAVKMEIFEHWSQDKEKISSRLNIFLEEFRRLQKISLANDSIANQLGIYAEGLDLFVLTEFVVNGSVKDYIVKGTITQSTAVKYLSDTLSALQYLHTLNPPVVHRDIKAANLLVSSSNNIKLANFGLVRDLAVDGMGLAVASEVTKDFRGSLLYIAPEVLASDLGPGYRISYSLPTDIWALGCTFIEMLLKFPPHFEYFQKIGYNQNEIIERASKSKSERLPYSSKVLVPSASEYIRVIVDNIFEVDPKLRPTASQLLEIVNGKQNKKLNNDYEKLLKTEAGPRTKPKLVSVPAIEEAEEQERNQVVNFSSTLQEEYTPIETIDGGVTRENNNKKRQKPTQLGSFSVLFMYLMTRFLYFMKILGKSVWYVLVFLTIGVSTLAFFLMLAYGFVLFFRYLIQLGCQCDISAPHFLVISGILLILLFALLFSCCMIAIGEMKHRMANGLFDDTSVFVPKPKENVQMCGVTVLRGQNKLSFDDDMLSSHPVVNPLPAAQDDFYYNS